MSSLTVKSGRRAALLSVSQSVRSYDKANRQFGRTLDRYRTDCPLGIGIAHVMSVNPDLEVAPPITRDRRRGFMLATVTMANKVDVPWDDLDKPQTCAYVWGSDINNSAVILYTNHGALFSDPGRDFWATAYLLHRMGPTVFDVLWTARDTSRDTVFDSILYGAEKIKRSIAGVPVIRLKNTLFFSCQFVVEMARRSGQTGGKGWGILPVLSFTDFQETYY